VNNLPDPVDVFGALKNCHLVKMIGLSVVRKISQACSVSLKLLSQLRAEGRTNLP